MLIKTVKIKNNCLDLSQLNIEISTIQDQIICINNDEYNNLNSIKNSIENVNSKDWTRIRKYSNIYESPGIKGNHVSRAFYKLYEILYDFNINCNTETLHLCDAPEGPLRL